MIMQIKENKKINLYPPLTHQLELKIVFNHYKITLESSNQVLIS